MISLLKNHQHHSSICFLEKCDNHYKKKWIIKSSSTISGIKDIVNELHGIDWYNTKSNYKISYEICAQNKRYIKVRYAVVEGVIPPFSKKTYFHNVRYIEKVIEHYCHIWNDSLNKDNAPLHGDLSLLGNVLFVDDETPVFIDWEHFHPDATPIGFDALYFLFELVWFELQSTKKIIETSIDHLNEMVIKLIINGCLNKYYYKNPLESLNHFMRENKKYWAMQYYKMPTLLFTTEQIKTIDSRILFV